MSATPSSDAEAQLLALRQRLRAARAERGACPPWEELRDDLLPGGKERAGRDERLAHKELCPYCSARVEEWQKSFDHASDTLGALEKGVARGVVAGALKIVALGRRDGAEAPAPSAAFTPPPDAPAPISEPPVAKPTPPTPPDATPSMLAPPRLTLVPPPPPPLQQPVATKPAPKPAKPSRERPAPRAPERPAAVAPPSPSPADPKAAAPLRLLVVEAAHESHVPESVHLCAAVLGAEVACVTRIEDLAGDPDLDAVCAIVLAAARPDESWPEVVRRARDLAPSRPVVVLAPYGVEISASAARALGGRLLSMSDSAERLLVALDSRLR